jgi:hypothetical protein
MTGSRPILLPASCDAGKNIGPQHRNFMGHWGTLYMITLCLLFLKLSKKLADPSPFRKLSGAHIMLRDLLTQKCTHKKRLLILDSPEHVESENIKFKI